MGTFDRGTSLTKFPSGQRLLQVRCEVTPSTAASIVDAAVASQTVYLIETGYCGAIKGITFTTMKRYAGILSDDTDEIGAYINEQLALHVPSDDESFRLTFLVDMGEAELQIDHLEDVEVSFGRPE